LRIVSAAFAVTLALLALGLALVVLALGRNGVLSAQPPGFGARLAGALGTNLAILDATSPYPELRPREWPVAEPVLRDAVAAACERLGWDVHRDKGAPGEVHATVTTPLLRFRDDVTLVVEPGSAPGTARLGGQSRSRLGRGDLGANARHLTRLLQALDAALGP